MNVHYVQHGPFEHPGVIRFWATQRGHTFKETRVDLLRPLPEVEDFDLLILSGGPCSLRQSNVFNAFQNELHLLQQTYQKQKSVLGICLGAQLIAESLGGRTVPSPHIEIGVFPVTVLPEGLKDPVFSLYPKVFDALHLHSDMFALTKETTLLASSEACPHQAFRLRHNIYGIQYHIEKTIGDVQELIDFMEMPEGRFVTTKDELKQYMPESAHSLLITLLDFMVSHISG